jgi:hypothetical protein
MSTTPAPSRGAFRFGFGFAAGVAFYCFLAALIFSLVGWILADPRLQGAGPAVNLLAFVNKNIPAPQAAPQDNPNYPKVTDAVRIADPAPGVCHPGDWRYSWHGRSNNCLSPQPGPRSYIICNPRTGLLAWYNP